MADMLSQAEIDALLGGTLSQQNEEKVEEAEILTEQEKDALGEIGNISMGTSATTLFTLLGNKVLITTPAVTVLTKDELAREFTAPCVAVRVEYTYGLVGTNVLILKEDDVKVITDLMMGGDGRNTEGELTDLHLSAIAEAMNQMIGSAATSISSMFNKKVDISPPKAYHINLQDAFPFEGFDETGKMVRIAFRMVVGELIDSEIMQLLPINFAKEMARNMLYPNDTGSQKAKTQSDSSQVAATSVKPSNMNRQTDNIHSDSISNINSQMYNTVNDRISNKNERHDYMYMNDNASQQTSIHHERNMNVNVQPAEFQSFSDENLTFDRKNINLIMDVPLQITVELGRTHKKIREILEFGTGSIVELDKLAGEPVDILVNGKHIAKGEVVVIDESFGVRITDIADPSKRL